MSEERKRQLIERKKAIYECNKELLEIDPNLIIQINLKWMDCFNIVNAGTIISYLFLFKKANKTKRFFGLSAFWLVAEWNIATYHFNVYPFILLKNTKEVMEREKALGLLNTN